VGSHKANSSSQLTRGCSGHLLPLFVALGTVSQGFAVRAQTLDVGQHHAPPSPDALLRGHTAQGLGHLEIFGGLAFHFASNELLGRMGDEVVTRPIAHRTTAELGLGLGLLSRLELGLALPVVLAQTSHDWPDPGDGGTASGLGDLRLGVKGLLLPKGRLRGFGLAAALELSVPTGRRGELMGEPSVTFTPSLILDWRHPTGLVVALNAGYRVRKRTVLMDLALDDELRLSLGAEVPLRLYRLSLVGELAAAMGLGKLGDEPRVGLPKTPVEALAALRWRHPAGLVVTAGAGVGLTGGYGAPDLRVLFSIGYTEALARHRRKIARTPGEASSPYKAAARPEATPSARRAGSPPSMGAATPATGTTGAHLARPASKQPMRKPGAVGLQPPRPGPLADSAFDRIAAADPDADGDGIHVPLDRCPGEPEDKDGFEDEDGCPDQDNDKDGIPDVHDKCPMEPETVNGFEDEDGCPDQGQGKVTVTGSKINVLDKIYFEGGSDQLKPESYVVLRQVAGLMKANWRIKKARVEGHTDNRGDPERNVDLSVRRAYRVRAFLVQQGVKADRLVAEGLGPKRPVATNETPEGRAKNRRVEFVILEMAGEGGSR
jgi:outer membrane protein OmpA-like peptidoglycan-associated protein